MPDNIKIDTSDIEVRILRTNRKSVVGHVLPNGNIEVCVPLSMTTEQIKKWLDRFEPQYLPIVKQRRELNASLKAHPFGYGGGVLFRGEWIPIREAEDDNNGYMARYANGAVVMKPGLSEADMRSHISYLFCDLAVPIFEKKLHHYSDIMDVWYKTWTIGNARKSHGSCNSNRKITISWLVVMMSEPVIELIIVHELLHLKCFDHSKTFRDELAAILPDWKERKNEHGKYTHMLSCSGWI